MINAAVIGLGVGEQHARYYHAHKECNLIALCDLDLNKATKLAEDFNVQTVTSSWKEICENPSVDIISIASFDHHHAEQVITALKADKHLFVEKPLCITRDELNKIHTTWKNSNAHIISNLPLRTAPLFRWLKKEIAKGNLGEIYAIDAEYLYGRVQKITHGWRKDIEDYSVIEGGGIHMLDLILYLTDQYPSKVSSIGNKIVTRNTNFKYEDYTASTFEFDNGLIARLSSNFGCVHPHQHIMKIFGTKATFILDDLGGRLQTHRDPLNHDDYQKALADKSIKHQAEPITLPAKPQTKAELIDDLITVIKNKKNKELTLHEFRLMNACLGAVKSLKSRQIEEIGTIDE